ncbi:hypothetical protein G9A89_007267 [Geosiphon pyriformis]|nr:hypothetical protein G9A89_007267 [Geosiphon pyriformis]
MNTNEKNTLAKNQFEEENTRQEKISVIVSDGVSSIGDGSRSSQASSTRRLIRDIKVKKRIYGINKVKRNQSLFNLLLCTFILLHPHTQKLLNGAQKKYLLIVEDYPRLHFVKMQEILLLLGKNISLLWKITLASIWLKCKKFKAYILNNFLKDLGKFLKMMGKGLYLLAKAALLFVKGILMLLFGTIELVAGIFSIPLLIHDHQCNILKASNGPVTRLIYDPLIFEDLDISAFGSNYINRNVFIYQNSATTPNIKVDFQSITLQKKAIEHTLSQGRDAQRLNFDLSASSVSLSTEQGGNITGSIAEIQDKLYASTSKENSISLIIKSITGKESPRITAKTERGGISLIFVGDIPFL